MFALSTDSRLSESSVSQSATFFPYSGLPKANCDRLFKILLVLAFSYLLLGAQNTFAADANPRVELQTSEGTIILELESQRAPRSVENFLEYVNSGFYDGTIFHRVIQSFMIQGGGFTPAYEKKPTNPPIKNEANNGLRNHHYTIAMARTNAPHSATAQFFINTTDQNDFLDYTAATQRGWGYAVFGRVIDGKDVVDKISRTPTGANGPFSRDVPIKTVTIERAKLIVPEPPETEPAGNTENESAASTATDDTNSNKEATPDKKE